MQRSIPFAALLLTPLLACTVGEVDFTGKTCEQPADCPAGYVCASGVCVKTGQDPSQADGGSVDAGKQNLAPTLTDLRQLDGSGRAVAPGATVKASPTLAAAPIDPEGGPVRLEVELVPSTSPFTGTPNFAGEYATSGSGAVSLGSLEPGNYRWQARAVDAEGNASAFEPFNGGATAFTLQPHAIDASLQIEDGAAFARSSLVTLRLQASSRTGATITGVQLSNDNEQFSPIEPFASVRPGWKLEAGDGPRRVYARILDSAGESVVVEAAVVVDSTPPAVALTVGDGTGFARVSPVSLLIDATDATSGLATMAFSNDGQGFSTPAPFEASATWPLVPGDGNRKVTVRIADKAGNVAEASASVFFDATPPTGTLTINGGAPYTSKRDVTLALAITDASGPATVALSQDGVTFGPEEPFLASRTLTLNAGEGQKRVWARVVDRAGNSAVLEGEIVLDETPPGITDFQVNGGAAFTSKQQVELTFAASDALSGVGRLEVREGSRVTPVGASPVAYSLSQGDGARTLTLAVVDKAGNSATASQPIHLDTARPSIPQGLLASPRSRAVVLEFTPSTDAGSGVKGYEVGIAPNATGPFVFEPLTTEQPPLTQRGLRNDTSWYFVVRAVDHAGNVSAQSQMVSATPRFAFEFQHRLPAPVAWRGAAHFSSRDVVLVGDHGVVVRSREQFRQSNESARRDSGVDETLRGAVYDGQSWTVAVGDRGVITASDDQGNTWTPQLNGSGRTDALHAVAALPAVNTGERQFIAVGAGGVAVSGVLKQGVRTPVTFTPIALSTTADLMGIAASTLSSQAAVVAVGTGTVLYSSDRGATFQQASLPTGYAQMKLRAVAYFNSDNAFYATGEPPVFGASALLRSGDGGKTWTPVTGSQASAFSGYAIAAQAGLLGTSLYVGGTEFKSNGESGNAMVLRLDSQSSLSLTNATGPGRVTAIAAASAGYATAGTEAGAVLALSGGSQWTAASSGAPVGLRGIAGGANTAQLMWLVGEGGYVANSANRGASWTAPASPVTTRLNGVATPDGTQAFAVGQGGVILRAGGTTGGWFSDPSPVTDELHAVSCASSSSCFAVGDQATILVWNGQRFLLQERASGAGAPRYLAVHAWMEATGGRRTVVVGTGGVVRHSSTSTFATSAIAGGGTLVAVDSARSTTPGYVLAANDTGAVFRSDDGGASWSPAGSLPPGVKLTGIAIGGSGRWFASTEAHGAFTSADHGASWVPLETNFRGRFDFVYSPPGNSSWLGGAGGALLYTPYQNGL